MNWLLCSILMGSLTFSGCKATKIATPASSEDRYVQLSDRLFISKYETSNLDYRSYQAGLSSPNDYQSSVLDTSLWRQFTGEVFASYYHSHPGYDHYPVVTVSYEQAARYCEWLTGKYNADAGRKLKKVLFRLPTEQEWILAANGGDSNQVFPWKGMWMRNRTGKYLANFRIVNDADIAIDSVTKNYTVVKDRAFVAGSLSDKATYTATVNSFSPTDAGLYNMAGNVAEMVAEKGISKGGSWFDTGYYLRNAVKQYYKGPSITNGFRIAMEVIEK